MLRVKDKFPRRVYKVINVIDCLIFFLLPSFLQTEYRTILGLEKQ